MAIFDYKTTETTEGNFDIDLPLAKVIEKDKLLFQQVDLLLNTYTKEFLYDVNLGMPYDDILGEKFDITTLESIYYAKISALIYFKSMTNFVLDIDKNRNFLVSFTVTAENEATQNFTQGI